MTVCRERGKMEDIYLGLEKRNSRCRDCSGPAGRGGISRIRNRVPVSRFWIARYPSLGFKLSPGPYALYWRTW